MTDKQQKVLATFLTILTLGVAYFGIQIHDQYPTLSWILHIIGFFMLPALSYLGFKNYPKYKHVRAFWTTFGYLLIILRFQLSLPDQWDTVFSWAISANLGILMFAETFIVYL